MVLGLELRREFFGSKLLATLKVKFHPILGRLKGLFSEGRP